MLKDRRSTKKTIQFKKTVTPLEQGWIPSRIEDDGTIERIVLRFYSGQENALQVRPTVEYKGRNSSPMDIIDYPANMDKFMSGDDDYIEFEVDYPVKNDDHVKLWYKNTSATYSYTLFVLVTVDYLGGTNRVV